MLGVAQTSSFHLKNLFLTLFSTFVIVSSLGPRLIWRSNLIQKRIIPSNILHSYVHLSGIKRVNENHQVPGLPCLHPDCHLRSCDRCKVTQKHDQGGGWRQLGHDSFSISWRRFAKVLRIKTYQYNTLKYPY